MKHQIGQRKLNKKPGHRRALIRNQAIHFITHGVLQTTKPRVKEVQRFVERLVSVARVGKDFNTIRRVKQAIPYSDAAIKKLVSDIAPRYAQRPGGYTRTLSLGKRPSDQASILRLEWV